MNIYTFSALFTLRIQYEYYPTQYEEGAKYDNVHQRTRSTFQKRRRLDACKMIY